MDQQNMPPELVIFDCDGVLVDTEGPTNEALAEDLSRYGPPITARQAMDRFVGGTMETVFKKATASGYALPEGWVAQFYQIMFAALRKGVAPIEGIVDFLDVLDEAGIPYCVGSNGPMDKMEITLVQTGLMNRLRGRIYSPHVIGMEHAKPSGGLYLHAARETGFAPEKCVVIEDSVSGAKGAKAAGIRCFGLVGMTDAAALEAVGAVPIARISQLPGLLGLR